MNWRRGHHALLVAATVLGLATLTSSAAAAYPASLPPRLECQSLELDEPLPVGVAVPCPGIRPGALIQVEDYGGCTANFVFRATRVAVDGSIEDEGLFIGTAGHCALDGSVKSQTWGLGTGPAVVDSEGMRFGEVAAALAHGLFDIAMIRVDDDREEDVNPALCHFGGPTELADQTAAAGTIVRHFGHGSLIGYAHAADQPTLPGRSGVVAHANDGDAYVAGVGQPGDSGSPVITEDGAATGVLVGGLGPTVLVMTLHRQLEAASDATGLTFELLTGPLAP